MTDTERNGVFHILNAISNFTACINIRMGSVVCPEEQQKMKNTIQEALKNMDFFKTKGVKEDER